MAAFNFTPPNMRPSPSPFAIEALTAPPPAAGYVEPGDATTAASEAL